MNTINTANNQNYWDLVKRSMQANTLTQVSDAKQAGHPVDVEQLRQSNQQLRDAGRKTGVELYSQQLVRQSFETYTETSQQMKGDEEEEEGNSSNSAVYTFDSQSVNDALNVAQKRAVGVSLYENLNNQVSNASSQTTSNLLNVYA